MSIRFFCLLNILFLSLVLLTSSTTAQVPKHDETVAFFLSRSSCYGKCPVYSITIYKNGTVNYMGIAYTPRKGIYLGKLSKQQFQLLTDKAIAIDFFELLQQYPLKQPGILDFPTCITYSNNGKEKKTIYNRHDGPKELIDFELLIDKTVESLQLKRHSEEKK